MPNLFISHLALCCLLIAAAIGCSPRGQQQAADHGGIQSAPRLASIENGQTNEHASGEDDHLGEGRTTVVWISVDGMRPDYLDRADAPTLQRLVAEGAFSRQMEPPFPSLTFPAHLSKATGVLVEDHGVPGNTFYDARQRRVFRYPPFSGMVEAEAIWFTAARQGIRVAALDWPMAHRQEGQIRTAYSHDSFDSGLSDHQRLEQLVATWRNDDWRNDDHEQPLRLLMTWIGDVDRAGHANGPDSDEVLRVVEQTDELLGWFVDQMQQLWSADARAADSLLLVLSTDHGMSAVEYLVNLANMTELDEQRDDVSMVTSGNVANLHFDRLAENEKQQMIRSVVERVEQYPFAQAYRRDELPARLGYRHPYRVGEVVIVLQTGYTFSSQPPEVTLDVRQSTGPLGMHGYDPQEDPNMMGLAIFHRWPQPWGGVDVGHLDARQFHPTVARWLGIEPAAGVEVQSIDLEVSAAAPAVDSP